MTRVTIRPCFPGHNVLFFSPHPVVRVGFQKKIGRMPGFCKLEPADHNKFLKVHHITSTYSLLYFNVGSFRRRRSIKRHNFQLIN